MKKKKSVFMSELSDYDIKEYLKRNRMILIPVGSLEQHGDHAPLGTDTFIPNEISKRVAIKKDVIVAPPINYSLSSSHKGASGLAYISSRTFLSLVEEICSSLIESGFQKIILVNGHYSNIGILTMACNEASKNASPDAQIYPISYWEALPEEQLNKYLSINVGLHANVGETSAIMAIDPSLVDLEKAKEFWPKLPKFKNSPVPALNAYFEAQFGSVYKTFKYGVWGNPKESSSQKGEEFLDQIEKALIITINEIEAMYRELKLD